MNNGPSSSQPPNTPQPSGAGPEYCSRGEPFALGDFELRRELGRGGMGTVYEAWQNSLQRLVAVKVLGRHVSASSTTVVRFQREAQSAAKLHHAHIVPIFAFGEQDGLYYYAMELVDGPGLNQIISQARMRDSAGTPTTDPAETVVLTRAARSGDSANAAGQSGTGSQSDSLSVPPPPGGVSDSVSRSAGEIGTSSEFFEQVARHIADVADAMDYAHRLGVIHRDIKPHNLLLGSDGSLKVADFGLARSIEQPGVTMTGELIGSPLYMPPEQISGQGGPADHRADIYSLGATMYEWLTLTPPYPGDTREEVIGKVLTTEAPTLTSLNNAIPTDLETICLKAIQRNPARRYESAGAFRDDLLLYLQKQPIRARRDSRGVRALKFVKRNQLTSLAVAAAVVAMALSWALLSQGRDLETQTAAVERAEEDRARLLDDVLSLMPAEVGSTFRAAEAAVPLLQGVVGSGGDAEDGGSPNASGGADAAAAGTATGIARRVVAELYAVVVRDAWPPVAADGDDDLAFLAGRAVELSEDEPAKALESLRTYLGRRPDDFSAHHFRFSLLARLRQDAELLDEVERLADLQPQEPTLGLWRGLAHLLNGEAQQALDDLAEPRETDAYTMWVLVVQGLARAELNQPFDAIFTFDDALDQEPDLAVALLGRAAARASIGNATGAITDLTRVLEIEPANADVLALRGDRYVEEADYASAASDYDRAIVVAGRTPTLIFRYLYARSQGHGVAKSEARSAEEAAPPAALPSGPTSDAAIESRANQPPGKPASPRSWTDRLTSRRVNFLGRSLRAITLGR